MRRASPAVDVFRRWLMPLDHADSNMPGLVGRVISGGLRVTERTGSSPQGSLYLAELDGREVVLLLLHAQAASGARLFKLATRIGHPNVAAVYGVGELDDGSIYVVLEQLVGEPLLQILTAGESLPLGEALELTLQVAAGLEAAHHEGFIHGNLSPSTVVVARAPYGKPQVKVVGFNLDPQQQSASRLDDTSIQYASPECVNATPPDKRSDVYSVGALFHHLLTGRPPEGPQPGKGVPDAARPVVAKALAAAPGSRFQTMSQLRDALEQLAAATTRPPHAQAYHTVLVRAVVAGVAVVAGALLVIPLWSHIDTIRSQTVSLPAIVGRDTVPPAPAATPSASAAPAGGEPRQESAGARRAGESREPTATPRRSAEHSSRGRESAAPGAEDVHGYVDQSSRAFEPLPPPESKPTPAPPRAPPSSPAKPAAPAPPRTVLDENQGLRQSIGDVIRIGLANDVAEASPGLLVLQLAKGGLGVPSAVYNLQRLYLAYSAASRDLDSVAIELRQNGRAYGWFTREGLRYARTGAEPR
jgi:serine/threonine-protein kinase